MILTEKPSVAREFANVLGVKTKGEGFLENDKYVIVWCVGHLVTMSMPAVYDKKYDKWNLEDLPFIPDTYLYEIIKDVASQYKVIKRFMNDPDIDTILYGGDSGREGEYIGRLVRMKAGVRKGVVEKRIWIDSCTEDEIKRGIREAKPLSEYDSLSDAAYERATEDFLVGINFSRALSCKYGRQFNDMIKSDKWKPLSVGRVMTCVLGMIVEKEREIRKFVPTDYYRIIGNVNGIDVEWKVQEKSQVFNSPLLYNEKGFKVESEAKNFITELTGPLTITNAKSTTEKKRASLLYNLAELQSDCSKMFKISPDKTLEIAQSLYEKKLTTYPRTDARVMSTAVAGEISKNIAGLQRFPGEIGVFATTALNNGKWKTISKSPYTDDSKITDHYAIIPTGEISALSGLNDLERKVFDIITRRFLAIFYPDAVFVKTSLECTEAHRNFEEKFTTSTKLLSEPGFIEVVGYSEKDVDGKQNLAKAILALKEGDVVVMTYSTAKSETQPPKRYSSGSIILAMENAGNLIEEEELRAQIKGAGIGTSATRAETISKLCRVGYIRLDNKTQILYPVDAGEILYDIVKDAVPDLLSPKMTANWELGLDQIRANKITKQKYEDVITKYVRDGIANIKGAGSFTTSYETTGDPNKANQSTADLKCPICKAPAKKTKVGYGCSAWNKEGTGCNFTLWDKQYGKELTDNQLQYLLKNGYTGVIKGFKKKDGSGTYDAKLVLSVANGAAKVSLQFESKK